MTRCPESTRIEAWLDQELTREAARDFARHLSGCAWCTAEVRAWESFAATLRAAPVWDPGPALTERILDRVAPSRVRRRQLTVVGWCYSFASAVTTFAFISWIVRPETHVWLGRLVTAAYARLIDTGLFVLDSLVAVSLRLQRGWSLVEILGGWVVPVVRALGALASDPTVAAMMWAALATCVALLWWMRPRPIRTMKGSRHVGILAF